MQGLSSATLKFKIPDLLWLIIMVIQSCIIIQMSLFIKFRNFLYILRIFYWFAFKAIFKGLLAGNISTAHDLWCKYIWEFLNFKIYRCTNSEVMRKQKTLIFSNHRSQADFWLHNIITQNSCNFLSRMLVGVVFFMFGIFANKIIWFFNRSGKIDHDKFNQWLNMKFQKSPRPSLLAYPEGHRMPGTVSVQKAKLKTGMIKYAYRQKIPVQLLMTFGNEDVFNEKKWHMGWDQSVYYSFSRVIDPNSFTNESQFVTLVKDEFCNYFDEIYQIYSQSVQLEERLSQEMTQNDFSKQNF